MNGRVTSVQSNESWTEVFYFRMIGREAGAPSGTSHASAQASSFERPFEPRQDEGLAVRPDHPLPSTVSFTVFTEKSTQNIALANAFAP